MMTERIAVVSEVKVAMPTADSWIYADVVVRHMADLMQTKYAQPLPEPGAALPAGEADDRVALTRTADPFQGG